MPVSSRCLAAAVLAIAPFGFALEDAPMRLTSPVQDFLLDVVYAPGVSREAFLTVGESRTSLLLDLGWRRDDATGDWAHAWEQPSLGTTDPVSLRGIASSGTLFLAAGNPSVYKEDGSSAFPMIATSPDGRTWNLRAGKEEGSIHGVAYGKGRWILVGSKAGTNTSRIGLVQYSADDGATWKTVELGPNETLKRAAFDGAQYVAVGESRLPGAGGAVLESRVYTSPDGKDWTLRTTPGAVDLEDIACRNGVCVAVGGSYPYRSVPQPLILRSIDGIVWKDVSHVFPKEGLAFTCITATRKGFLAAVRSSNGSLLHSFDGVSWNPVSADFPGSPRSLDAMDFGTEGSLIAMVGDTGAVWIDTLLETGGPVRLASREKSSRWVLEGSTLKVPRDLHEAFEVRIARPDGRIVATLAGSGSHRVLALPSPSGLHLVEIRTATGSSTFLRSVQP